MRAVSHEEEYVRFLPLIQIAMIRLSFFRSPFVIRSTRKKRRPGVNIVFPRARGFISVSRPPPLPQIYLTPLANDTNPRRSETCQCRFRRYIDFYVFTKEKLFSRICARFDISRQSVDIQIKSRDISIYKLICNKTIVYNTIGETRAFAKWNAFCLQYIKHLLSRDGVFEKCHRLYSNSSPSANYSFCWVFYTCRIAIVLFTAIGRLIRQASTTAIIPSDHDRAFFEYLSHCLRFFARVQARPHTLVVVPHRVNIVMKLPAID